MKKELIFIITMIFLVYTIHAFESNSSNYVNKMDITGAGGSANSSNYNNLISAPSIGGKTNSSEYVTELGFIHTLEDVWPPEFENNATNATKVSLNDWLRFNVSCIDNVQLHGFIFSNNNSGTWVNESYIRLGGLKNQSNFTLQILTDALGWKFICNDTYGNIGSMSTILLSFNTAPAVPAVIYPGNNAYLNRVDINFSSSDINEDTINYTIFINGTYNISTQVNISDLSIGDGSYYLNVSAYDGADYSRNSSIFFTKDTIAPGITLITPINKSGDNDGDVIFEYIVTDLNNVTNCSLHINDEVNLSNSTITKGIYQNLTLNNLEADSYNWSVNCTDIAGNTNMTDNRVFAVIKTTKFSKDTTDFSTVDVFALPNLILENPSYGKISLIDTVDLGAGADFDSYVNITPNEIFIINSTSLPLLNFSSDILLYNITYANPRPLIDDAACDESVCAEKSYINNTFTYNVTQLVPVNTTLITYSSAETPVAEAPSEEEAAAAAGGGGGASPAVLKEVQYDFRLSRDEITTTLKIGKSAQESLEIRNLGTGKLTFSLYIQDLKDFISISDYSFDLEVGERKTLVLNIVGKKFGIFIGKLIAAVEGAAKEIPIIIEIESEKALFDVKLDIPADSKNIAPGDKLRAQVTLFNILGGKVDVVVNYLVKDLRGNVVSEESETFAVETQSSYVKMFNLPENIEPGDYIAAIEVMYANSYAVSSQMFNVMTEEEVLSIKEARTKVLSIFFIVVVSALAYVYVLLRFVRKRKEGY